ncbi:hypothetical protein RhiirA4_464865 [Rhizophagus irregularis]|uniref:Uncharacterized protein n=1 Tax=Rhizophagus irregularis TaxID=588596 RepID=A0A2I1GQX3_9GLOM|nr:hypothetical protein RhiirA4_464865 [Rhizophagus irregularis]
MNQVELFYLITKRPFILTRLDDSSVWYIVDGRDPDIVEAKTILICSPLKAHYKEFNKKIPTVHKLFKEWGGIPRYIGGSDRKMMYGLTYQQRDDAENEG